MAQRPQARVPPMQPSDEANQDQLDLARWQGEAFERALDTMIMDVARGEELRAGDYLIGYAVEEAEGLYCMRDGRLQWEEPPSDATTHLEVVVRDGADGRFLPGLTVTATLLDASGREIGTHQQPFLWHPWLFHYGRNWHVPGDGEYRLRVRVEPPDFPRHDRTNGNRYTQPVEVEFTGVQIRTGRK